MERAIKIIDKQRCPAINKTMEKLSLNYHIMPIVYDHMCSNTFTDGEAKILIPFYIQLKSEVTTLSNIS